MRHLLRWPGYQDGKEGKLHATRDGPSRHPLLTKSLQRSMPPLHSSNRQPVEASSRWSRERLAFFFALRVAYVACNHPLARHLPCHWCCGCRCRPLEEQRTRVLSRIDLADVRTLALCAALVVFSTALLPTFKTAARAAGVSCSIAAFDMISLVDWHTLLVAVFV